MLEESEAIADVGGEVDGGYLAEIGAGSAEGLGRWRRRGGFLARSRSRLKKLCRREAWDVWARAGVSRD